MDDTEDQTIVEEYHAGWEARKQDTMRRYFDPIFLAAGIMGTTSFQQQCYTASKSITNSFRSMAGRRFEAIIEDLLTRHHISFSRQVSVSDGVVMAKKTAGQIIVDIIVPEVKIGDRIDLCFVISVKTSLRERFLQDSHVAGKKYLITLDPVISDKPEKNGFTVFVPSGVPMKSDKRTKKYDISDFLYKLGTKKQSLR